MMTLVASSKSFFTKLLIWRMQPIGINSCVNLCLVRRSDRKLEVLPRSLKLRNKVQSIGFESARGHLWHLEGTTNSFWGFP